MNIQIHFISPRLILILSLLLLVHFTSCKTNENKNAAKQSTFELPEIPPMYTGQVKANYIMQHAWENVNLADSSALIHKREFSALFSSYLEQAFLADLGAYEQSVTDFYKEASPELIEYVNTLTEDLLYSPNSYFRRTLGNSTEARIEDIDELYYIYMKYGMESKKIFPSDSIRYQDRIKMYLRNKPGNKAEDFKYRTLNKREGSLYQTAKDRYCLLMFFNPGCHSCEIAENYIKNDPYINTLLDSKKLTILMIYVDYNLDLLNKYKKQYPPKAIVGHEYEGRVNNESLYDLRAMPILYLLDPSKTVIYRDAPMEKVVAKLQELGL